MVTKTLTIISEKNYVFATLYKKYRVFQPPYLAGINSFFLKPISSNPPKSGSKIVPTGRLIRCQITSIPVSLHWFTGIFVFAPVQSFQKGNLKGSKRWVFFRYNFVLTQPYTINCNTFDYVNFGSPQSQLRAFCAWAGLCEANSSSLFYLTYFFIYGSSFNYNLWCSAYRSVACQHTGYSQVDTARTSILQGQRNLTLRRTKRHPQWQLSPSWLPKFSI